MSLNNITAIIFDLGGVLVNIDDNKSMEAFQCLGFNTNPEAFKTLYATGIFQRIETGHADNTEFRQAFSPYLPEGVSTQTFDDAWAALLLDIPPERVSLLRSLKKHYRCFALSNTNALHVPYFTKIFEQAFGGEDLHSFFEQVFYSHEMKLRKPDPEIYRQVIRQTKLNPEQTLFIDDRIENIQSAQGVGLQAIHLYDQDIIRLFGELGYPVN